MNGDTHLEILEDLAGRDASYARIGQVTGGPTIHVAFWKDFPEPGMITGFTVGLSAHRRFGHGQLAPELVISVESTHEEWVLAAGHIALQAADTFSFDAGETVDFGTQVAPGSEMTAFLLTSQMILPPEYDVIHTPHIHVALRQLVPLYRAELLAIRENGPAVFTDANPDPASVTRPPVIS